jgi:F-type H+-transporting ATPase subunit gamma
MSSLRQIRQRMKAIHNIHEITQAMAMIASFRFKKAQNRFTKSRNYFLEMERLAANLVSSVDDVDARGRAPLHPLFETRKIHRKALVVMTGDKGLCGAYNSNLLKAASVWLMDNAAFNPVIVPVAKVGNDFFRKKSIPTLLGYPEKSMADFGLAKRITEDLKAVFLSGRIDSVEILYAAYRAGTTGRPQIVPFLGLSHLAPGVMGATDRARTIDYIYEPDPVTVLDFILRGYLEAKITMTLLESLTSESSARMIAMTQATDNAQEVLDHLNLLKNKTRQATITRELSEIVAGANVLV